MRKRIEFKFKINLGRILLFIFIFFFLILPILGSFIGSFYSEIRISLSDAMKDIQEGRVEKVEVQENKIFLFYKDGSKKISVKEEKESFGEILERYKIDTKDLNYEIVDQSFIRAVANILGFILPIALTGVFFFLILKSQAKGVQDIFSFGKSRARLFAKGRQRVTFKDVAGVDEAKKELEEVVDFLKNPEKYRKIGARTPKGVLLFGPAGVGKTLLARAVAGEAGVPFFSMAGSEFMEMLVGVGASRVRDLFSQAKAASPSIIFIDEIDAIGRQRGRGFIGGHDEREQTLNQILVEMDGFTPNDNVIVIAATNRVDLLDPALLRPGRFDRRIALDMPDKEGRKAILRIHARGKKFARNIDWEKVAEITVGFSGADLENMLNEAAILAARENKKEIESVHIQEAATKVKLGPAKKKLQSKEDREITAYHEAGHAIVSHFLPKMDPVQRISIVARGLSLGHTFIPAAADRAHETRSKILEQISAMLGGRAAEEVVFNEMTAGAASDIESATRLAKAMVIKLGMSELGPIDFGSQVETDEFGTFRWYEPPNISPSMQEKIDLEVKKIITSCYRKSLSIVRKRRKLLDKLVQELLKRETLDREDFEKIVGPKKA